MAKVVYSRHYNIGFYGLERLHPFDSRKYGRVWRVLKRELGSRLKGMAIATDRAANREELRLVHTEEYLKKLGDSEYVARALELPIVARLPAWMVDWHVLRPMRWATRGTMLAAQAALEHGLVINLSGGYHHAKPDQGEGFSIYADIGIAVQWLRAQGRLSSDDRLVYVDTDAHQGNGVSHTFLSDNRAFLFDIFHGDIYPRYDLRARERIDCPVPITAACTDQEYLRALESRLPGFLDSVCKSRVGLAIYNAGTDIFAGDPIGGLQISAQAILQRDCYVVSELRKRNLPTVMLLSGGYTRQSYRLVADSVLALLSKYP